MTCQTFCTFHILGGEEEYISKEGRRREEEGVKEHNMKCILGRKELEEERMRKEKMRVKRMRKRRGTMEDKRMRE